MNSPDRDSRGFTILEMLIGMMIFLILSTAVLGGMASLQKNYRTGEMRSTMQQRLRATMELMAQEIGQAGLQSSTIDGNDLTSAAPYTIATQVTAAGSATVTISPITGIYVGQWLQVPGGLSPCTSQDAIQINAISGSTITATFGCPHPANTAAYPMGIFPHGIIVNNNANGSNLTFFGWIRGTTSGLFAVEYSCPTTYPGQLVRKEFDLSQSNPSATQYPMIDNVTACYFCWPGSTDARCPTGTTTPDSVSVPVPVSVDPSGYKAYPMITQVGFTITTSEMSTITGSNQPITITKSYSNIQPRNIIAADNIYKLACASAINAGGTCTPSSYGPYLNGGELQPDPAVVATIQW